LNRIPIQVIENTNPTKTLPMILKVLTPLKDPDLKTCRNRILFKSAKLKPKYTIDNNNRARLIVIAIKGNLIKKPTKITSIEDNPKIFSTIFILYMMLGVVMQSIFELLILRNMLR
jgi:hypothetical protein